MVYFGQDGCPYCTALMQTNFSQKAIVEKTRRHFVAIALNIWGDREVTWTDGRTMSEKALARALKVQFTPTLLFLDERGAVAVRLNGYYAPHRFEAALDYVIGRMEKKVSLADHLATKAHEAANPWLADEPFFLKPPYDLRRSRGGKPLAVLFETPHCAPCDELHREGFKRTDVTQLLKRFDVVRLSLADRAEVVTPAGAKTTGEGWARLLGIAYTPSMVFFDGPTEVLRVEAYLRPFHLASALDYVASGAYRKEPSFQRFIQARAERLRERGEAVDLWK
jgi:thioredoxin-related protein